MKIAVIYNKEKAQVSDVINIFGPQTKETYNPKTVERVATALEKGGHNIKIIEGNINVAEELYRFMPKVISGEHQGMVFNMAYGIQGQSRYTHIPAMLEMLGVSYIGSGPQAHAIALDKVMTKIILQRHDLPTPKYQVFSDHNEQIKEIDFPVIVKPKMEAVSLGLKVVYNKKDLPDAVKEIIEIYKQPALVESFITGREFAIGLLGNGAQLEIFPIVEIDFKGKYESIQTHDDKKNDPYDKICPANISDDVTEEIRLLAHKTFNVLDIYDFGRVDMRMDNKGNLYILEFNSMASLGESASFVHAAKTAGYSYDDLINKMVDVAAERYFGDVSGGNGMIIEKPIEKRTEDQYLLRSYLRNQFPNTIELMRQMVDINSHYQNIDSVDKLGNWISNKLGQLGFQREIYPQADVGTMLYFSNHTEEINDILLLSHLDYIYGINDFIPFHEKHGHYYGSGIAKSKGGLALMLSVLSALRSVRGLRKIKCGILLTTDYSIGGIYSRNLVENKSRKSKYVIGLNYGDQENGIITSCYGRGQYIMEMTNNKNAVIDEVQSVFLPMCKKIISIQKLSDPESEVFIEPIGITAKRIKGSVPDFIFVTLDIKYGTIEMGEKIVKEIKKIAQKNTGKKLKVNIKRKFNRPPIQESEASKLFFNKIEDLAQQIEVKIQSTHRTTSSDICYVPKGIPALDGFGPLGGELEFPNEFILKDSIIDRATLLARIISNCAC